MNPTPLLADTGYPAPEDITRQRMMDAAVRCIEAKGLEKMRIGDVAAEMGIARQTVYNHFPSKNALLVAAFEREGFQLAEQVSAVIAPVQDLGDKFVKALLFIYDALPRNVILRHLTNQGGQFLHDSGMSRQTMEAFGAIAFAGIFRAYPSLQSQADEISEVMIRFVMSLLMLPDQSPRSGSELEAFIRRRLIPSLGLGDTQPH